RSAVVCPTGPLPMTMTGASGRTHSVAVFISPHSPLQSSPDLTVALGGPDGRMFDAVQLLPQPGDVEGKAVLEDRPAAVLRSERFVCGVEGGLDVTTLLARRFDGLHEPGEEATGLGDRGGHRLAAAGDHTTSADEALGVQGRDPTGGLRGPVAVIGVAGVEGGLGFDQIAGVEDPVAGQPGDDVARGVAAPEVEQLQLAAITAEVDRQLVAEGDVGPGQSRDRLGFLEQ